VKQLIREGYEIESYEKQALKKARQLEKMGLISLEKFFFIVCRRKRCGFEIPLEDKTLGEVDCPKCQGVSYPKEVAIKLKMRLNEKGIFNYLLKMLARYNPVFNKAENVIDFSYGNRAGKLAVLDFCFNTFLFEPATDDFVIRILADSVRTSRVCKGMEGHKFCTLEDIVDKKVDISKTVETLFAESTSSVSQENLKMFNNFVKNLDLGGKKLEEFVERLCEFIQDNRPQVNKFMLSLEKDKSNIWGARVVRLGGSGRTDLSQIALHPYLYEFLKSDKNFECKSWKGSYFKTADFGSAIKHALTLKKKGVNLIVISKRISPSVWEEAISSLSSGFKIILIDDFVLLRLLNGINGFTLIS
jgi:hypothetical protein